MAGEIFRLAHHAQTLEMNPFDQVWTFNIQFWNDTKTHAGSTLPFIYFCIGRAGTPIDQCIRRHILDNHRARPHEGITSNFDPLTHYRASADMCAWSHLTVPERCAPVATCTWSPIWQSCSMIAPLLMITFSPITAPAFTMLPGRNCPPRP